MSAGCSVIEVFDDSEALPQALPGKTAPWDALEPRVRMDALALRRTDIYSYGLLVRQIMCNGRKPYDYLYWDNDHLNVCSSPRSPSNQPLLKTEFQSLKSNGSALLLAAIESLDNRIPGDVPFVKGREILCVTIQLDPDCRARGMGEIIALLRQTESSRFDDNIVVPKSEPLARGDFGISKPTFPTYIHWLRTSPPSFRSLICDQLYRNSRLATAQSERALASLALAVCYEQGLYPSIDNTGIETQLEYSPSSKAVEALSDAANLGNPLARSLIFGLIRSRGLMKTIGTSAWEWLVSPLLHGSIRSRKELKRYFPKHFDSTTASVMLSRSKVALALDPQRDEAVGDDFLNRFPSLDPAAKAALTQQGLGRLHQASYLGSQEACKGLLQRGFLVSAKTKNGETPLHFAAKGGQPDIADFLINTGVEVNAQTEKGTSALHFAFLSFEPAKMVSLLLSRGADPNTLSSTTLEGLSDRCDYFLPVDGSPLHCAVMCEDLDAARFLLDAGAKPNLKSGRGMTPLQGALQLHSKPLLDLLLPYAVRDLGDLPDVHSLYPFLVGHFATPMARTTQWEGNQAPFIMNAKDCFEKHGIDLDDRGLLGWAIDSNNAEIVELCLQKLIVQDGTPITPYRYRGIGHRETGVVVDVPLYSDLRLLLSNSIGASSLAVIKVIIKYMRKPIPSRGGAYGTPYLCGLGARPLTTLKESKEIATVLVEAGAAISAVDEHGHGPLNYAATFNNYDAVDALLDFSPATVDIQEAISICIMKGSSQAAARMMRSILEKCTQVFVTPITKPDTGASSISDLTKRSANWLRMLSSTWELGRNEIINAVLLREAIQRVRRLSEGPRSLSILMNEEDNTLTMYTPLHHAALTENKAAAEILLEEGADVNYSGRFRLDQLLSPADEADTASLALEDDFLESINRGATPLDCALTRSWYMTLCLWPEWNRQFIQELRNAGGANKEEREYNNRTNEIVRTLREHGAKTKAELFNIPELLQSQNATKKTEKLDEFRAKNKLRPTPDSETRILRFYGASCGMPSRQLTMSEYPDLIDRVNPDRPKFSTLFAETVTEYVQVIGSDVCAEADSPLYASLQRTFSEYTTWAERNGVAEGELDNIQRIPLPTKTIILAAGILVCLCEILRVLQLTDELLSKPSRSIDFAYRCEDLLDDLKRAVTVLTSEELSFKVLSDLAVADFETQAGVSIADITSDGRLRQ